MSDSYKYINKYTSNIYKGYNSYIPLSIFFSLFIIFIYYIIYAKSLVEIFSLFFSFCIYFIIINVFYYGSKEKINYVRYITLFMVVSAFGMLHAIESYTFFNNFDSTDHDDLMFYNYTTNLYKSFENTPYSYYEYFVYAYGYPFKYLFNSYPSLMVLVPFNWMLISSSIVGVDCISKRLTNRVCPYNLLIGLVVFNFYFQYTAPRLYRDSLVIFLSVLYILLTLKRIYYFHLPILFTILHIRGGNAIILLLFSVYYLYFVNLSFKRSKILLSFIFVNIIGLLLVFYAGDSFSKYVSHNYKKPDHKSVEDAFLKSSAGILTANTAESSTSKFIYDLGIAGIPIRPIYSFSISYRIMPIETKLDYSIINDWGGVKTTVYKEGIAFTRIIRYFALIYFAFWGKYLLSGFYIGIKSSPSVSLLTLYIITIFIILSISSLSWRHMTLPILLYPFIISNNDVERISEKTMASFSILCIIFSILIFIISIVLNLFS